MRAGLLRIPESLASQRGIQRSSSERKDLVATISRILRSVEQKDLEKQDGLVFLLFVVPAFRGRLAVVSQPFEGRLGSSFPSLSRDVLAVVSQPFEGYFGVVELLLYFF